MSHILYPPNRQPLQPTRTQPPSCHGTVATPGGRCGELSGLNALAVNQSLSGLFCSLLLTRQGLPGKATAFSLSWKMLSSSLLLCFPKDSDFPFIPTYG